MIDMNNIILEDGYNTDYMYSMIIALFYNPTDEINQIINTDTNNYNVYYIQEYIKLKFIYQLHHNISIESAVINKFRLFLYNCGWQSGDILSKAKLDEFYIFMISNLMKHTLHASIINPSNNTHRDYKFNLIHLTHQHVQPSTSQIIGLSTMVSNWVDVNLISGTNTYKFENIPNIIPIYIDLRNDQTGLNEHYIDITEGLAFTNNGNPAQRSLIWSIHSMICQTSDGTYYCIVFDADMQMMAFSDKSIPSNQRMDPNNLDTVKKIMQEVRFVFYKL